MELQYIILTIIKILISVPTIVLIFEKTGVDAAALIGGHINNHNSTNGKVNNITANTYDFKIDLSDGFSQEITNDTAETGNSEEIPNPSPLVIPGYNLPENIFNRGKPFYLEKDPLTGTIDFNSKNLKVYDDEYEYEDETALYDKSSIDRKDGPINGGGHHKPSDINQLTPNFHDFLNLPVKYNPDKYVYPLISSSYANTKVQGNVNKHQNHKNYVVTTYKPTYSPTYFTTKANNYNNNKIIEYSTRKPEYTEIYTTLKTTTKVQPNLMNSPMNHPSFNDDYETTVRTSGTTKRAMSLFEQLFGSDYDESTTEVVEKSTVPHLFNNLPSNKKSTTQATHLMGGNMGYEYDDVKSTTKSSEEEEYEYDYVDKTTTTTTTQKISSTTSTTEAATSKMPTKVTSLPLGENHVVHNNRQPIIVSTQNLREQLSNEKVKFGEIHPQAPSTSNVHIAPDQDTVSFVVGNHQNVDGGNYVGSAIKESPYDNNPFRPVYDKPETTSKAPEYIQASLKPVDYYQEVSSNKPDYYQNVGVNKGDYYHPISSSINIQPLRNSEASLAIGSPLNKPGHVVDENVDEIEITQGAKIVFPDDRTTTLPDLSPPPPPPMHHHREVLKLSSKPMFHQLPSDLTPPNEKEGKHPQRLDRVRPPWDPRPGHFHAGRPEYARPPRPVQEIYKRIDNLPNILPQFRPNVPKVHHHYPPKNYARQPLLERPSNNRPIGFFEKLHPPPPPPKLMSRNKPQEIEIMKKSDNKNSLMQEPFAFLQAPPKIAIANRRSGDDPETLQMIQAKKDTIKSSFKTNLNGKDSIEKPLYVVYPVNTPPLKLDAIDNSKKESVVIGTRAELPLPPNKITQDNKKMEMELEITKPEFHYEMKDRHDAPILKPRPGSFPIKSDFPYPLERPDPNILMVKPEASVELLMENKLPDEPTFISSNQWNTIEDHEARIVNNNNNNNQISVTLKTYTEKPIAVAYTPTEKEFPQDKFSMPNYGSIVIPEIRPGSDSEFTVSAVMHAHPPMQSNPNPPPAKVDRVDEETTIIASQDFQAPFQASAHIDHSISQGWAVVRDKEDHKDESTTMAIATTSEFDIENFNPQLEGGFKPIYSYPDEKKDLQLNERQE